MTLSFSFSEEEKDISDEQIDLLCDSLKIIDRSELEKSLSKLATASFKEYLEMILGKGIANRADEAKQDRLFYLIKNYFHPYIPGDDEISIIFQLTPTQSKTLLRNTLSRYRTKISRELSTTLKSIHSSATKSQNDYHLTISSEVFLEILNQYIARQGPDFSPIRKRHVGNRNYKITSDSYRELGEYLNNAD